jgi:hypothetical protein
VKILDLFSGSGAFGFGVFKELRDFHPTLVFVETQYERIRQSIDFVTKNWLDYDIGAVAGQWEASPEGHPLGPFTWIQSDAMSLINYPIPSGDAPYPFLIMLQRCQAMHQVDFQGFNGSKYSIWKVLLTNLIPKVINRKNSGIPYDKENRNCVCDRR